MEGWPFGQSWKGEDQAAGLRPWLPGPGPSVVVVGHADFGSLSDRLGGLDSDFPASCSIVMGHYDTVREWAAGGRMVSEQTHLPFVA